MNFEQYQAALDDELRAGLAQMRARYQQSSGNRVRPPDLATQRMHMATAIEATNKRLPVQDHVKSEDRHIPGPQGAPDVLVRIYAPTSRQEALPAILWIHGGSFTLGRHDQDEALCQQIVTEVGAAVISIDYRLAPEHPYPAALEDCYATLQWITAQAADLGLNPERLAVAGTSSGGALAMALTLLARDRQEIPLTFTLLIYPALDDRLVTPSSHEMTDPQMIAPRQQIVGGWQAYLGNESRENLSPYASPARAEHLTDLPPTYIMVGELDPLRDEDISFAMRLMQSQIPTELHVYPGAFHGFERMVSGADISKRAVADYITALKHALHH